MSGLFGRRATIGTPTYSLRHHVGMDTMFGRLFEIFDDRYDRRSTLIAAQLPIEHWHQLIGDPTLADAILDRLIHNAHKIDLKGESMRKKRNTLTDPNQENT